MLKGRRTTVRALQYQNVTMEQFDLIMPIIKDKLPHGWKLELARQRKGKKTWTFQEFINFLEAEMVIREAAGVSLGTSDKQQQQPSRSYPKTTPRMSASALMASTEPNALCTFCEGDHRPWKCPAKMTVQERYEKLRKAKACYICGLKDHLRVNCFWNRKCNCGENHIHLLCRDKNNRKDKGKSRQWSGKSNLNSDAQNFVPKSESPSSPMTTSVRFTDVNNYTRGLRMRTVCVQIGDHLVRALCDTGATYTFVSAEIATYLPRKLLGQRRMKIETLSDTVTDTFNIIELNAKGVGHPGKLTFQAMVTANLKGGFERVNNECYNALLEKVGPENCPLADLYGNENDPIGIIFGEDCYDRIVIGAAIQLRNGFKATPTIFGWMLHGGDSSVQVAAVARVNRATVQEQLSTFWNLEHMGIQKEELVEKDLEEDLRSDIKQLDSGHYVLGWPWKPNAKKHLALNKGVSEARLQKLLSKQSEEEYKAYDDQIQSLLSEGHIEELPAGEKPLSYLPHRGIVKTNSETTQLRIVKDASAKSNGGLSLNDSLDNGPNLLPLLWGVFLRFRLGEIALTGDLEKAFLQMVLKEEDRNACCFLWKGLDDITRIYRMKKVMFGAKPSPFMLQVTLKHHLEQHLDKRTARALLRNVYVDDIIQSMDSPEEAIQFCEEAKTILLKGRFNLRKFKSNAREVCERFKEHPANVTKVLGVTWNTETDSLLPLTDLSLEAKKHTKREAVSLLARVYDPLGLVSPVITDFKCFTQDLWLKKIGWDEPLDEESKSRLNTILANLQGGDILHVDRWLHTHLSQPEDQNTLHVFTDASSRAYAAAAYIRVQTKDDAHVALVASKCRLGPPTGQTIPRMELLGALLGARLLKSLLEEFNEVLVIQRVCMWIDSTTVIAWLEKGPGVDGVFVSNRVEEIRSVTHNWAWVPSEENPADLPTRGKTITELTNCHLWWYGPKWLSQAPESWPQSPIEKATPMVFKTVINPVNDDYLIDFVDPVRTSQWNVSLRSMVWILRWKTKNCAGDISKEEVNDAQQRIFQQVQRKFFTPELTSLRDGKPVPSSSNIKTLQPFLDKGVIRMGGRLEFLEASYEEKHPVVLNRCGIVDLLVLHTHRELQHGGTSVVICELRRHGVWILRAKKSVSAIIRNCRKCRRFIAAPASEMTPPFPESRIKCTRPFDATGIDLAGPLYLKDGSKIWFALFTCMSIRAIHLELLSGISEDIMAGGLQRFMSRRGEPKRIISDHGTNFVALSRWLKRHNVNITWEFIVERAPWWGGAWERMIGTVKGLLRRTLGKTLLTWEEMTTVLTEIEKVVNRRPISFLREGAGPEGIPLPLTPEHFLLTPHNDPEENDREFQVLKEFRNRKEWLAHVRDIWEKEYLWQVLGAKGEVWKTTPVPLEIGEVVIIESYGNRLNWRLGVISQLHAGRDGRNRAATVRVQSGLLRRPIQKLYRLELYKTTGLPTPVAKTPSMVESSNTTPEEKGKSDDDPDKLWCICRKPHEDRFMICCDTCEDWFHGDCVNITEQQGHHMEEDGKEYECPECIKRTQPKKQTPNEEEHTTDDTEKNTAPKNLPSRTRRGRESRLPARYRKSQ